MNEPVRMPDGRVITDLSEEEYNRTYLEGTPHSIPDSILEEAIAGLHDDSENDNAE